MTEMHHFGDEVWLHTVIGAKKEAPDLHRIRNLAAHFRMAEDIGAKGGIIHEDAWRTQTITGLTTEEC